MARKYNAAHGRRRFPLVLAAMTLVGAQLLGGAQAQPAAAATATVTVNWGPTGWQQRIDGFGASGAFHTAKVIQDMPEPKRTQILDLLFSPTSGIGLSIVRSMIGDGWNDPTQGVGTIEPSPGVWDWTKDNDQVWLMQQAAARGVAKFVSVAWSAPAWMKTNGSVTGGQLSTSRYSDFATYLSRYVNEYKTRFGITISHVSPANEPDQNGTVGPTSTWSPADFDNFIRYYMGPTFSANSPTTRIVLGENSTWSDYPASTILNNPGASPYISVVSSHDYNNSWWLSRPVLPNAQAHGKAVWQTEVSYWDTPNDPSMTDGMQWANTIYNTLSNGQTNAWLYWLFANPVNNSGVGASLLVANPTAGTYTVNKRLYTLGNFSKFLRPDSYRISTSNTAPTGVKVVSFHNTNGQLVVVAINDKATSTPLNIALSGGTATTLTPYVTNPSSNLAQGSPISFVGGTASVTMSPWSVTTYVSNVVN